MSAEAKGPRLWFKRGNVGAGGKRHPGTWTIKDDGNVRVSTGVRAARAGKPPQAAQDALARYILERRQTPREKHRGADAVEIADVIAIYMSERAPHQAREAEVLQRCRALLTFWGDKKLSAVSGRTCREYAAARAAQPLRTAQSEAAKKKRVSIGTVRRELEDLRAAINYHRKEGYCREFVEVTLPDAAMPRDRWLTRSEAARLIWAAWRFREEQKGHLTGRRSRRHVARFVLVGLYTGTRAGAVCAASLGPVQGSGWIDLERGVFYRKSAAQRETKKRQPPVRSRIVCWPTCGAGTTWDRPTLSSGTDSRGNGGRESIRPGLRGCRPVGRYAAHAPAHGGDLASRQRHALWEGGGLPGYDDRDAGPGIPSPRSWLSTGGGRQHHAQTAGCQTLHDQVHGLKV